MENDNFSEYVSPFLLILKTKKLINLYRNSRLKLPVLEGYSILFYVIYSIIILGFSGFFCYKCMSTNSTPDKVIGFISLAFSIIAPIIEIVVITGAKKILNFKGIFYLISLEMCILAQATYNISLNTYSLWGIRLS